MSRSKSELEGLKMEDQEEEETEEEDLAHIIYVYMYIIRREIMGWGDLSQKAGGGIDLNPYIYIYIYGSSSVRRPLSAVLSVLRTVQAIQRYTCRSASRSSDTARTTPTTLCLLF